MAAPARSPARCSRISPRCFSSAAAPNPHDVATAVATLIGLPKGERPARTFVSQPFGSDAVNAATAPVQQGVVEALGLGHLATLKT
jgi:hypothetical protein